MIQPADAKQLGETVAAATSPFAVESSGSKRGLGRAVDDLPVLSLAAFNRVTLYEPEELVLEAGSATPLGDIEALLAKSNQRLAFEPPNYARILRSNSRGTIGGMIACNLSGPRRIVAGAARDHILGVSGVNGRGEFFKAGGRVVKNVTGYDIAKLLTGSFGTLAALTSITMKVLPAPETEATLLARILDVDEAGRLMRAAMQSPFDVAGAACIPHVAMVLRLEGIAVSVKSRTESLIRHLNHSFDILDEVKSRAFWKGVRDIDHIAAGEDRAVWRISVAPSKGPGLAETLARETGGNFSLDWAGGLIWLDVPATGDAYAQKIRSLIGTGHATLFSAPEATRRSVDVFHPQPGALSDLTRRVKQAFDPRGLLNPYRMSKEF
jgi:glycolate oxidase FAD binding subunit